MKPEIVYFGEAKLSEKQIVFLKELTKLCKEHGFIIYSGSGDLNILHKETGDELQHGSVLQHSCTGDYVLNGQTDKEVFYTQNQVDVYAYEERGEIDETSAVL